MHVLLFPSWYPNATGDFHGSFFREQAEALVRGGMQAGVLAIRSFAAYELTTYLSHRGPLVANVENGVRVTRGSALLPLPKATRLNLAVIERVWRRAYREYVTTYGAPDVLHSHSMFPAGIVAARLAESEGIPLVISEHRPSFAQRATNGLGGILARESSARAAELVAVSPGFADALNEAYETTRWQAQAGLLAPPFSHSLPTTRSNNPIVFGHVSHLDAGKRVDLLLRAFGEAFGNDPAVRLRVVGAGAEFLSLKSLAASLGLENIDFIGAVERELVPDELDQMHVFALPSDEESFGTVFWEALARGLPLIATDTWGGQWAVTKENGILVPRGDVAALRTALIQMRDQHSQYDPERLRKTALELCGEPAFTERMRVLYRSALLEES